MHARLLHLKNTNGIVLHMYLEENNVVVILISDTSLRVGHWYVNSYLQHSYFGPLAGNRFSRIVLTCNWSCTPTRQQSFQFRECMH